MIVCFSSAMSSTWMAFSSLAAESMRLSMSISFRSSSILRPSSSMIFCFSSMRNSIWTAFSSLAWESKSFSVAISARSTFTPSAVGRFCSVVVSTWMAFSSLAVESKIAFSSLVSESTASVVHRRESVSLSNSATESGSVPMSVSVSISARSSSTPSVAGHFLLICRWRSSMTFCFSSVRISI